MDKLTAALSEISALPQTEDGERYYAVVVHQDASGTQVTRCISITKETATRIW